MKQNDLLFEGSDWLFGFRSAGILLYQDQVLLQRGENDQEFALLGGHVVFGETSDRAVVREFQEELGVEIHVQRLLWIEELFWAWNNKNAHSLCHYYLVSLSDSSRLPENGIIRSLESDESRLLFQWVKIDELNQYPIYPSFFKTEIHHLSKEIKHFITYDV